MHTNALPSAVEHAAFPFRLHWTPQDLADAVPLKLSELLDFDAVARDAAHASNQPLARRARVRTGYAAPAPLTALFRVG